MSRLENLVGAFSLTVADRLVDETNTRGLSASDHAALGDPAGPPGPPGLLARRRPGTVQLGCDATRRPAGRCRSRHAHGRVGLARTSTSPDGGGKASCRHRGASTPRDPGLVHRGADGSRAGRAGAPAGPAGLQPDDSPGNRRCRPADSATATRARPVAASARCDHTVPGGDPMTETATVVVAARPSAARTLLPGTAMIAVTFGLARYGYGLLLPDMRADVQMTASTAGLISSAAYLSYMAANIGVVAVLTRWGPRVAVGGAALLAAVGMGVIAGAHSVMLLAIGVVVAGAAAGMSFPPYADIVAGQVRPEKRDVGVVHDQLRDGLGCCPRRSDRHRRRARSGEWHGRSSWRSAVVVGALAVFHAPAAEDRRARLPQLSITWFFCPKSRPLLLSAVLVGVGSSVWWAFSVDAMRQAGIDSSAARLTYAVCGVGDAARLVQRRGVRAVRASSQLSGLDVPCSPRPLPPSDLPPRTWPPRMLAAIVFGAVYATVIAVHGVWSSRVFEDHPSAGLAAVNTALTIGTLAGPTLGRRRDPAGRLPGRAHHCRRPDAGGLAVQPADGSAQGRDRRHTTAAAADAPVTGLTNTPSVGRPPC